METKILEIVNTILKNRARRPIAEWRDDLHLRDDIGFDSLDLAELTVRLEAEFDIDVFENGLVGTAGEIRQVLDRK